MPRRVVQAKAMPIAELADALARVPAHSASVIGLSEAQGLIEAAPKTGFTAVDLSVAVLFSMGFIVLPIIAWYGFSDIEHETYYYKGSEGGNRMK